MLRFMLRCQDWLILLTGVVLTFCLGVAQPSLVFPTALATVLIVVAVFVLRPSAQMTKMVGTIAAGLVIAVSFQYSKVPLAVIASLAILGVYLWRSLHGFRRGHEKPG
jgi:hypothetical protein